MTRCENYPELRVVLITLLAVFAVERAIPQARGDLYSGDDPPTNLPPSPEGPSSSRHECKCDAVAMEVAPVCADGQVFINMCLALCQGVVVTGRGWGCAKAEASPLHMVPARWMSGNHTPLIKETPVMISQATMALFSKEGYSFAGPAFSLDPGATGMEVLSELHKQDSATSNTEKSSPGESGAHERSARLVVAVRVTSDGLMYTKAVPGPADSHRPASAVEMLGGFNRSPSDAKVEENAPVGRKLQDLREITDHEFPWSAIGHVSPQCTGSLIAPNKVLTAGHCVWSAKDSAFIDGGDFFVNTHGGGLRFHQHGSRRVRHAFRDTMFVGASVFQCSNGEMRCYSWEDYLLDFAVITLEESLPGYGTFRFFQDCGALSLPVTTAGYPADRPGFPMRMFYDTSTLSAFDYCEGDQAQSITTSSIETQPGQSGSPLWVQLWGQSYLRAIHLASGPIHRGITAWMAERIWEWM